MCNPLRRILRFGPCLFFTSLLLLCTTAVHAEATTLGVPQLVSSNGELTQSFSVARSDRQTAIAWEKPHELSSFSKASKGTGSVKVRVREGDGEFGPITRFGTRTSMGAQVTAISGGRLLLAYAEANGQVKFSIKRPGKKWTGARNVRKMKVGSYVLRSGPDGTALLAGKKATSKGAIVAARLSPGSSRLRPLGRISRGSSTVGLFLDATVDRRGRGHVIWSGPCPLSNPKAQKHARAVLITARGKAKRPRPIRNTKCPSVGVSIKASGSSVYAKIDGNSQPTFQSIRVAVKRAGKQFQPARQVNPSGSISMNGQLNTFPNRTASLIMPDLVSGDDGWNRVSYLIASSTAQSGFSPPVPVESIDGSQILLASSPYGRSKILTLWQSIDTWALKALIIDKAGHVLNEIEIETVDPDQLTKAAITTLAGTTKATLTWGYTMSVGSQIGIGHLQTADLE